ncbi:hypothetical protein RGQ13_10050 [Thalassotalea psychrophila]|uniref:Zn-ribbon protein n=1 Tax=Thalassotalea psychrophila TaxID=3065647 RepID=A0ABY9TP48_9GAMM|nr:hypothetical protein RGQ13_10050 [Colwelliaceae bacterium SQ149]
MALINCPKCSKRISSKAAVCNHCQCILGDLNEEQRVNMQQLTRLEVSQKLMNQSMVAMLLFCGGFGFMFWGEPSPESWQYNIAAGSAVLGFSWYIINRVRILMLKKK